MTVIHCSLIFRFFHLLINPYVSLCVYVSMYICIFSNYICIYVSILKLINAIHTVYVIVFRKPLCLGANFANLSFHAARYVTKPWRCASTLAQSSVNNLQMQKKKRKIDISTTHVSKLSSECYYVYFTSCYA